MEALDKLSTTGGSPRSNPKSSPTLPSAAAFKKGIERQKVDIRMLEEEAELVALEAGGKDVRAHVNGLK
jgi:hypothetical protein